ncbi:DUF58 domain-containing protein [Haloarcula onubensis]|uniref:DUF58 domain-containing protein n=1 Tax=Haloarcula onubensis TaxID=2950539 RepID=A0ABU2FNG8_9EURY|nr:DUF58 domain-containing protein [Halomicroarcula sp. S3CR25-11]MDS0282293.1 DUF58 domain-containing protein [Halomicroarcula sp. S3CR25-11]
MTVRSTGRWRGIAAVALCFVAVGVLTDRPATLLVGVVGAGLAAYPRLSRPPTVDLELERRLADSRPGPGEPVTVTTRVTNTGGRTLADCRIVDGVPAMLSVASGSPRHAAVLRPGETTEFSYDVETEPGRHQFDPATVVARDITGAHEVETTVAAGTEIQCADAVPELPVREQPNGHAGRLVTDEGGSGIEFHSVREYRPGDPMGRIDSKRWARTGELTTVEFREERPTSVLLLVDARAPAYRAPADGRPNAVAHCLAGVEQLVSALSETRDAVGLAAFGRELCFRPPGVGSDHETALWELLATHPAFDATPPGHVRAGSGADAESDGDIDQQATLLRKQLGSDTQVVVLSPLADEAIVETVRTLAAAGHTTTVISPDVTAEGSLGRRLARRERRLRLRALRGADIPVVDWDPTTPLGTVLLDERRRRWSV